jgi:tripartite-type tricarboxylate transporter receptor subunit TctC
MQDRRDWGQVRIFTMLKSWSVPDLFWCVAVLVALAGPAAAQEYPSKPIRFVVPFPAGSGTDTMTRLLLDEMKKTVNATVIVDNRAGALGQIGTEQVARAAPDGYTVMISSSATHSSGPQLAKSVPYDPIRDFTHIGRLTTFDVALMVNPQQGFRAPADLIAEAKRSPDKLTYGYGSATAQVVAATFVRSTAIQVRGVPYKGQPPALNDLLGGQINFVMADLTVSLPHTRSGKLAALAVASPTRSGLLPSVPTFTELGIKDMELQGWTGISGPANLPRDVVAWWSKHVNATLEKPEFVQRLNAIGVEGKPISVEAFVAMVREQYDVWGKRIRDAGITPE